MPLRELKIEERRRLKMPNFNESNLPVKAAIVNRRGEGEQYVHSLFYLLIIIPVSILPE